jgi:transcription initiation factor TFIID TATA-box-binding protein
MKINNIVCSGDLNQQVPFERLPELPVDTYKYDPTRYHGAYILLTEGKATIYKSGKYIIYGLKSLDSVNQSYEEFLAILSPIVDSAIVTPPAIRNIVGMDDFHMKIPLSRLVAALQMENVEYEPEQFPGVIYRGASGTALIFSSGKVIFAGCKDMHSMEMFSDELRQIIELLN